MDKNDKDMLDAELKELRTIQDIKNLEGVKTLTDDSRRIIVNTVNLLATSYFEKSDQEIRALCATLAANLAFYQRITGIDAEIDAIEKAME